MKTLITYGALAFAVLLPLHTAQADACRGILSNGCTYTVVYFDVLDVTAETRTCPGWSAPVVSEANGDVSGGLCHFYQTLE